MCVRLGITNGGGNIERKNLGWHTQIKNVKFEKNVRQWIPSFCNDDDNYMDQPPHLVTPAHFISCRFDFCFIFKKSFHFFCLGITWSFSYISPAVLTTTLLIISSSIKKKMIQIEGGKRKPKSVIMIFLRLYTHTLTRTKIFM